MLRVVCLCAEWCSACRAWRPDWDALAARHPQHRWQWLDIEDEPDLMDAVGLDIETFPTVLVAHEGRALFLGLFHVFLHLLGLFHQPGDAAFVEHQSDS